MCYLLSTMSIINMFSHQTSTFCNPIHKLICAPSAGHLLSQLQQRITELYMNSAFCGGIIGETTTEKNLPWNRKKFPSNSFLYIIAKELSLASLTLCIYYLRTPSCYNQLPTVQMYAMKLIRRLLGQPSQTQPFGRTGENRKMGKKRIQMYIFMCLTAHKFKSLFL